MKKSEAIEYIITCTQENMDIKDMDSFVRETLLQEYNEYTYEELLEVLRIYDKKATIDEKWETVKTVVNSDGVYIYFNGEEIVSWLWEEVEEDNSVFGAISQALHLAHGNPQKLLFTLGFVKYYDVYVNDGCQGFSVPVEIQTNMVDFDYEDLSVAQYAHEIGLVEIEDLDYVQEVREIDYDEYLQMKA